MNIEQMRNYCLRKKAVTEDFPFDEDTLVFRVMNKIFALTSVSSRPFKVNLKMNPDLAEEYRARYNDVQPGYHMNKKMWNTVLFEGSEIPTADLKWMIDHSYDEVVKKLTKKEKAALQEL